MERTPEEMKALRRHFIERIYKAASGRLFEYVPFPEIGEALGLDVGESIDVLNYLEAQGLTRATAMDVALTAKGISLVEGAEPGRLGRSITNVLLETEQERLLERLVEALRSIPENERGAFVVIDDCNDTQVSFSPTHSPKGQKVRGSEADAEALADAGLLARGRLGQGGRTFRVTPQAIAHYEKQKKAHPSTTTVEAALKQGFLDGADFRRRHSHAADRWARASEQLWAADSQQSLTTIGHLCREAMQEFVSSLARLAGVTLVERDATKTVRRLQEILAARSPAIGGREGEFLAAIVAYWGTVSDLNQRQEHGAQRDGDKRPLGWEDARRCVFQACVVMYEVDRSLLHQGRG